jgi:hypothetical protein
MYPSDTTIEFVGLEEKLAMGRIVKPQSAADMGNVALTDDLFEGIHELLFSLLSLLSRLPSGLEMAMLQSLHSKVSRVEIRYKRMAVNPIFPSLKPVKL